MPSPAIPNATFNPLSPKGKAAKEVYVKQNGFDAFVTFIHPSSKYSGPGTDGFLVRDYIMELTPQSSKGSIQSWKQS
jgi:hypothetical protein